MKAGTLCAAVALGFAYLAGCTTSVDDEDSDGSGGSASDSDTNNGGSTAGTTAGPNGGSAGESGSATGGASSGSGGSGADSGNGGSAGEGNSSDTGGSAGAGDSGGSTGDSGGSGGATSDAGGSTSDAGGANGSSGGSGGSGGTGEANVPVPGDGRETTGPLILQVTTPVQSASPGQRQEYVVSVGNTSSEPVEDVAIQLRVPEGLQFHYQSDAVPNSAACAGLATCSPDAEANWALGTLEPGTVRTIRYNPNVLETVEDGDSIESRVQLSAQGISTVSVTKTVPVLTEPEIEFAFTAEADPVLPGSTTELHLDLGQTGDMPVEVATFTLELPTGMTVVDADGGSVSDGTVSWDLDELGIGETLGRSVVVEIADAVTAGEVLNPRATLSYSANQDWTEVVQLPITVVGETPPLTLTLTREVAPALPGGTARFFATVTNTSFRPIAGDFLWFRQPRELQHHYQSHAAPNLEACAGLATCSDGLEVWWDLAELAPGSSTTYEIDASILEEFAPDGHLVTTFWGLSAEEVPELHASFTIPVNATAKAELALGASATPVLPGDEFTYDLDIGQIGGSSLANTQLTLLLPEGVTADAISGAGELSGNRIVWDIGSVPVAGSSTQSVTVTASDTLVAGDVLKARALLTYNGGDEVDATAEYAVSVTEEPFALGADLEVVPEVAVVGEEVLFTTTVSNLSERSIEDVSVWFRVPEGLQFHYQSDVEPNSAACAGLATCSAGLESVITIGTLTAGQTEIVSVNATLLDATVASHLVRMRQGVQATDVGGTLFIQKTLTTTE